jgi:phosphate transport system protein
MIRLDLRKFDRDGMTTVPNNPLQELREEIFMMAGLADRNLTLALRSVFEEDAGLAELTETEDAQLDELENLVDALVVRYITRHRPLAGNLRAALVVLRAARDFERIGDLAVGIARFGLRRPPLRARDFPEEFSLMSDQVLGLLRRAVRCLASVDAQGVSDILGEDLEVNRFCDVISDKMMARMTREPESAGMALTILVMAQSLERIADHAKAIAEEVFYLVQAVDIRHKNVPFVQP